MNSKIALLSDIHGNMTALEAVINDSKTEEATEYCLLGDLVMPGPGAHDLFELLRSIPIIAKVKGNWDDCFLEVLYHEALLDAPSDIYIARLSQYLAENLNKDDVKFIEELPLHTTKEINEIKFSISHNLPNKN